MSRRSMPLLIAGGLALALVLLAVVWHNSSSHQTAMQATNVQHAAAGVSTVELDGINGSLTVGVGNSAQISATAQPANGHSAPALVLKLNAATHVLTLICPNSNGGSAATCPASTYAVLVPAHVGVTLHEVSGQAVLTGLSGPISITAASADTSAQGLLTTDFSAAITSGTLNASFATAPTHVSVTVISAQASLQFPASASYDVRQKSVSADIQVNIPQSSTSVHTVQVSATSGEINLGTGN